jgi:hypothetical protein
VIYGLGEGFDGNLRKRDLLADTPYNTYHAPGSAADADRHARTRIAAGLHCIRRPAMRSISSLVAMAAASFSRTLAEHNQAVMRYQKGGPTLSQHESTSSRGKFITFEGIDGAGKSSHIASRRGFRPRPGSDGW